MPMQKPVMPPPPGLGAAPPVAPASPPLPDFTSYRTPPIVPNPGRGAPSFPAPFDPATLPQGARLYEDGSVTLSPEAARTVFANQAGGPSALPPGPPALPPEMASAMPLMTGLGADPMGNATPPPVPSFGGRMPGQPPAPPTDPAGALMFEMQQRNAPAEPPRPPLSAPPSATPPPRDQWPAHLQASNAGGSASGAKAPMERLRNRGGGNKPPARRRG